MRLAIMIRTAETNSFWWPQSDPAAFLVVDKDNPKSWVSSCEVYKDGSIHGKDSWSYKYAVGQKAKEVEHIGEALARLNSDADLKELFAFCREVTPAPAPELPDVKVGEYTVQFLDNGVKVGCTEVTDEIITEIAKRRNLIK